MIFRINTATKEFKVLFWTLDWAKKQCLLKMALSFPGGAVVKNPPANAGDTGLSPGPGRSHMPQSN